MAEAGKSGSKYKMASGTVHVMMLEPGVKIKLSDGSEAEVVENPRDGYWIHCRYLSSPSNPELVGTEEAIFANDVVDVVEE